MQIDGKVKGPGIEPTTFLLPLRRPKYNSVQQNKNLLSISSSNLHVVEGQRHVQPQGGAPRSTDVNFG